MIRIHDKVRTADGVGIVQGQMQDTRSGKWLVLVSFPAGHAAGAALEALAAGGIWVLAAYEQVEEVAR